MPTSDTKIGYLIVSHGEIGEALLRVARYILDAPLANFASVRVPFMSELPHLAAGGEQFPFAERQAWLRGEITAALKRVDGGRGVIILTDIVGGTAFGVARDLLRPGAGALIAGVNLPMVLKAAELSGNSLRAATTELMERSRRAIIGQLSTG